MNYFKRKFMVTYVMKSGARISWPTANLTIKRISGNDIGELGWDNAHPHKKPFYVRLDEIASVIVKPRWFYFWG